MDIAALTPSENTFEIKHPVTDENVGIRVSLMSPDDDRMKPIKRQITDFNLQKQKTTAADTSKLIEPIFLFCGKMLKFNKSLFLFWPIFLSFKFNPSGSVYLFYMVRCIRDPWGEIILVLLKINFSPEPFLYPVY